MDGDVAGEEPTLNAEAGLTPASAAAAGSHGYVDNALHAGFITKQTPLPEAQGVAGVARTAETRPKKTDGVAEQGLELEPAEQREPSYGSEAGSTMQAAGVAHGFVDKNLHAGFISKQTPRK